MKKIKFLMMKEEEYKVKEYPNKEKGFFIDENEFAKFSYDLFNFPIFGIICGIFLNIVYILSWKRKMSIASILTKFFIHYLIIEIILINLLKIKNLK